MTSNASKLHRPAARAIGDAFLDSKMGVLEVQDNETRPLTSGVPLKSCERLPAPDALGFYPASPGPSRPGTAAKHLMSHTRPNSPNKWEPPARAWPRACARHSGQGFL